MCVCVATPHVTKHVWSSLVSRAERLPSPRLFSEQDLIANVVAVAENTADELARSDGREVRLEEDPDLQLPFLLPEDGSSCDVVRNVPSGLQEFLDPLCQRGGSPSQPGRPRPPHTGRPGARCVLMCVRPPHVRTPGALLGRSGPGEWRDAVSGDVGSEPGVARPPGAPLLTRRHDQVRAGVHGTPGHLCSPALVLSSLWFRVRLGLHPSCVSVPPEQSIQQQGQTSPEPPVTLTFHPGRSHAACPPTVVLRPEWSPSGAAVQGGHVRVVMVGALDTAQLVSLALSAFMSCVWRRTHFRDTAALVQTTAVSVVENQVTSRFWFPVVCGIKVYTKMQSAECAKAVCLKNNRQITLLLGFPGGPVIQSMACNARDGPWLGPWSGNTPRATGQASQQVATTSCPQV